MKTNMIDLNNKNVQIEITNDNRLWVNVDGICELRVYDTKLVSIEDNRNQYELDELISHNDMDETILHPNWIIINNESQQIWWNKQTGEIIIKRFANEGGYINRKITNVS